MHSEWNFQLQPTSGFPDSNALKKTTECLRVAHKKKSQMHYIAFILMMHFHYFNTNLVPVSKNVRTYSFLPNVFCFLPFSSTSILCSLSFRFFHFEINNLSRISFIMCAFVLFVQKLLHVSPLYINRDVDSHFVV